jgi:hypothetical protein
MVCDDLSANDPSAVTSQPAPSEGSCGRLRAAAGEVLQSSASKLSTADHASCSYGRANSDQAVLTLKRRRFLPPKTLQNLRLPDSVANGYRQAEPLRRNAVEILAPMPLNAWFSYAAKRPHCCAITACQSDLVRLAYQCLPKQWQVSLVHP